MSISLSSPSSSVPVTARRAVRGTSAGGRSLRLRLAGVALALGVAVPSVQAGIEPFIGEMMLVGFNFCPRGFAKAEGQLIAIAQNTALFSLLGTQFGGDGRTTFALPDLRGRTPINVGQGPGLSDIQVGQVGGTERVTILQTQMPAHQHQTFVSNQPATHATPDAGMVLGQSMNAGAYVAAPPNTALSSTASGLSGGNQPLEIRNPYLGMQWCIALQGIFPSRD